MQHTFLSWFMAHPRRAFVVLFVVIMLLTVLTLAVPDGVALAGSITSGS